MVPTGFKFYSKKYSYFIYFLEVFANNILYAGNYLPQ